LNDVAVLKQALPYMKAHKGKTFVVKLGGELVQHEEALHSLAQDIALLYHVGIRILVVHGGGPQATDLSKRLGLTPEFFEGRRITDEATLEVAKMVFAGKINVDILGSLRREGLPAVGLSGLSGDVIHAVRREPKDLLDHETGEVRPVDFGHVGDIRNVDPRLVTTLHEAGYVPVISSLGADREGHVLNINADTVATELAVALRADKLLVLTNVPGVLRDAADPDSLVSCLSASEAERLIDEGAIAQGMIPKVTNLIRAVREGVGRTHILSFKAEHALLVELFTKGGSGTMVTLEEERQRYLEE